MTDDQEKVFESVSRGRLIFPFRHEMELLQSNDGELTSDESVRLDALESAYDKIKIKDEWFNSAMKSGDVDAAVRYASEALAVLGEVG